MQDVKYTVYLLKQALSPCAVVTVLLQSTAYELHEIWIGNNSSQSMNLGYFICITPLWTAAVTVFY